MAAGMPHVSQPCTCSLGASGIMAAGRQAWHEPRSCLAPGLQVRPALSLLLSGCCRRYFSAVLPTAYWVGYAREAVPPDGAPEWVALDGSEVDQYPNNGAPYAHWSWNHFSRSGARGADRAAGCAVSHMG
jgi:hypothetical protein